MSGFAYTFNGMVKSLRILLLKRKIIGLERTLQKFLWNNFFSFEKQDGGHPPANTHAHTPITNYPS